MSISDLVKSRDELLQKGEGILSTWLREEGYSEAQYHRLCNLLDDELLLKLPVKAGLVKTRSPAGL